MIWQISNAHLYFMLFFPFFKGLPHACLTDCFLLLLLIPRTTASHTCPRCAFADSYICCMLCIAIADAFANNCTSYRAFLLPPGHTDMLTCAFAHSCPLVKRHKCHVADRNHGPPKQSWLDSDLPDCPCITTNACIQMGNDFIFLLYSWRGREQSEPGLEIHVNEQTV